jgi:hypothetical protein
MVDSENFCVIQTLFIIPTLASSAIRLNATALPAEASHYFHSFVVTEYRHRICSICYWVVDDSPFTARLAANLELPVDYSGLVVHGMDNKKLDRSPRTSIEIEA